VGKGLGNLGFPVSDGLEVSSAFGMAGAAKKDAEKSHKRYRSLAVITVF